ncbi:SCO family protein [Aliidiomarina sedimenti]|uniref:SCO family protein n=2 Tax=Aliidiomarina sedimenti TaxID=1933879 RepID=A0ABY0C0N6_9GAMM|nr:SCO family protein [Aliidiomarina sedimenti]
MLRIVFILLLALVAFGGVWSYQKIGNPGPPALETSLLYSSPRSIDPFTLQSTAAPAAESDTAAGHEVSNDDLLGQWTIIFTGYTFCPDICPTTMAQLKQSWSDINQVSETPMQVWMVSVDPQRDDIPRLREYVGFFNEGLEASQQTPFLGVRGEHKDLFPFVRNIGLMYSIPEEDETNYLVNHSAAIILISPEGHQQAVFRASHEPGMIPTVNPTLLVNDLKRIIRYLETEDARTWFGRFLPDALT